METASFSIPDISCDHCVATIERALLEVEGVASVSGDSATKQVVVQFAAPASRDQIVATLVEWGYPPVE